MCTTPPKLKPLKILEIIKEFHILEEIMWRKAEKAVIVSFPFFFFSGKKLNRPASLAKQMWYY